MSDDKRKRKFFTTASLAVALCLLSPIAVSSNTVQDRHETMVMNLKLGNGSAGFYLIEALRLSRDVEKDLRKAIAQIREVDRSYAKSRGKPDSRYLEPSTLKIARCQERTIELNNDIKEAFDVLKEDIKDTLMTGTMETEPEK